MEILAHGREPLSDDIDSSRCVGRFTTTFPLALEGTTSLELSAKTVAKRLRGLPDRGVRSALLHLAHTETDGPLSNFPATGIAFNYVGHFDPVLAGRDIFSSLKDLPKRRTLLGPRRHDLELHSYVLNGCLTLEWRYSASTHTQSTMHALSASLQQSLLLATERLNTQADSVLVIGATGALGGQISTALLESGQTVSALVRDPLSPRAKKLQMLGVNIVQGDLADRVALRAALAGCQAVVFSATGVDCKAGTGELENADRRGLACAVEEAEATGVERFVYISISGSIQVDSPLLATKRLAESRLARSSMSWTVLRSAFFFETWLCSTSGIDPASAHAKLYGGGKNGVSYIAQADVARAASLALSTRCWDNRVIELGGPSAVVPQELLKRLEDSLGLRFNVEEFDVERLKESSQAAPEPVLSSVLALRAAHGQGSLVDPAWATEIGLKLVPVEQWLQERGVALEC